MSVLFSDKILTYKNRPKVFLFAKIYAFIQLNFSKYLRKGTIQMENNLYRKLCQVMGPPQYFKQKRPIRYESVFFCSNSMGFTHSRQVNNLDIANQYFIHIYLLFLITRKALSFRFSVKKFNHFSIDSKSLVS